MQDTYCPSCDFTFEGTFEKCPDCGGAVELLAAAEVVDEDGAEKGSIGAGLGVLFLLHLLQLVFVFEAPEALFFMGITQAVYAVPAAIVLGVKGRTRTMGGVFIGAGITFFLNAAAVGLLCASMLSQGSGSY